MAIAPGVYSRNRFFELFKTAEVRRARSRALVVRGIVQHLAMLHQGGADVLRAVTVERHGARVGLRYHVAALHFERRTELSELETACVFYLAEKAGITGLVPTTPEREGLHAALRRLPGGGGAGEAALLLR
jgi:hypothetical protein